MSQIYFIHLREHRFPRSKLPELREEKDWNEEGNLLSTGGCTIAYQVHRMSDSLIIKYSVSECSILDRFRKDAGRGIAKKRLTSGDKKLILGEMELNVANEEDIEKLIVLEYYEYKSQYYEDNYKIEEYLYPHRPGFNMDENDFGGASHNVD